MNILRKLFSEKRWCDEESLRLSSIGAAVEGFDVDKLLNTSPSDLASYFKEMHWMDVPVLDPGNACISQEECQVDIRGVRDRLVIDQNRPALVDGVKVVLEIPFTGNPSAFGFQPSSHSFKTPVARVHPNNLILECQGTDTNEAELGEAIDEQIKLIQRFLDSLRVDADKFNQRLEEAAMVHIGRRRKKLLANQKLVANLGFNLKERTGASKTFIAPEVQRKMSPVLPKSSSTPFEREPAMGDSDYEHILNVVQSMVSVMERSPKAFHGMGEEDLRSHFLVQLNGHYEGCATGETFNFEGKTDILVRSGNKNIFIAECKFWSGPQGLHETINQILGYISWRDTKVAILLFSRNKDFSGVLAAIPEAIEKHPNFKRPLNGSTETAFRYCFANRDDPNREMSLAVLAFDIPQMGSSRS